MNPDQQSVALKLETHHGLRLLRFSKLSRFKELRHGVFSRLGGISRNAYKGLNVSFGVGDNPEHVIRNRELLARAMGKVDIRYARQVHGTHVHVVTEESPRGEEPPPVADALVTDRKGTILVIQVADCQPVLLYEPKRGVVANIHSGWRGSIANIIGKTVGQMVSGLGCRPEHMVVGIGPSLGPCCAEFIHYQQEIPSAYWGYKDHRDHFDFWRISRDQLTAAGVPASQIQLSGVCTVCHQDLFFSYRAKNQTGRFAAAIGMV